MLDEDKLLQAIQLSIPPHYNFEILKCARKLLKLKVTNLALQIPDGLLFLSTSIADIFENFCGCQVMILTDTVYGACCIDDLSAKLAGCQCLIHYGHSCLVKVDQDYAKSDFRVMYVHVEITIDKDMLARCMVTNFSKGSSIGFVATVQFRRVLDQLLLDSRLVEHFGSISIPQVKPLGKGEVLGCTAPNIDDLDAVVSVADGRFHLEALMMANPHLNGRFFRYDPFTQRLTSESFDYEELARQRTDSLELARRLLDDKDKNVCIILGTLGRQGNVPLLNRILEKLKDVPHYVILLSEISQEDLKALQPTTGFAVQLSCPRLSLDWGSAFVIPLLTPFEFFQLFEEKKEYCHPMDNFATKTGEWGNYFNAVYE